MHPNPISWSAIIEPIAAALAVATVPYADWLEKLEGSAAAASVEVARQHPALRVVDFYRLMSHNESSGAEALTKTRLDTTEAVKISPTLTRALPVLDTTLVKKWLGYWKRKGVLN